MKHTGDELGYGREVVPATCGASVMVVDSEPANYQAGLQAHPADVIVASTNQQRDLVERERAPPPAGRRSAGSSRNGGTNEGEAAWISSAFLSYW